MSLDNLQKQILDDAARRAEEAESEARKQASEILQKAKERAREIAEAKRKELEAEIARMEAEQRANSELQESNVLLDARNRAVEGFLPALKGLTVKRIKQKGYERIIALAIKEAEGIAPQEELVIALNKRDAGYLKSFKGKVTYADVGNGIEIQTKKGDVRITATIEGLFERNRQGIEKLLIEKVFSRPERKAVHVAGKKGPAKKARGPGKKAVAKKARKRRK